MENNLNFSQTRILVIGDLMLDIYYIGSVDRISPEAPVPVVRTKSVKMVLGGAANVCNNIAALGGRATIIGFLGKDENSRKTADLLTEADITNKCVITDVPCVTKIRVIGEHQQIVRIDFDTNADRYSQSNYAQIMCKIDEEIEKHDAIVISDYAKGCCVKEVIKRVVQHSSGKPVLLDPKHNRWEEYSGVSYIKPNLKELSGVAGRQIANDDSEIESVCRDLLEKYSIGAILITRSDQGMSLIRRSCIQHIRGVKQEVFDVSGAGDTVLATMALMVANGVAAEQSALVANLAGAIVVKKLGTAVVHLEELKKAIALRDAETKTLDRDVLLAIVKAHKEEREKIVFTNGCFDILHRGHVEYLKKAKELGSILIVGLNSDSSVRRLKGNSRPINTESDRAELLAALESVDYVTIFDEDTPHELIKRIKPDVLVKGGDYKSDEIVGREFAQEVAILPFVEGYSTTGVIETLKRGFNQHEDNI